MKRIIYSIAITVLGIAFINSAKANVDFTNHKLPYDTEKIIFLSSINSSPYLTSNSILFISSIPDIIDSSFLTDSDSLQLTGGFQEYYFIEKNVSVEVKVEESALSLDRELILENWMMEIFDVEEMDQEMVLEDWMLQPFESN